MIPEAQLGMPAMVEISPGAFVMGETVEDKFTTDTERPAHEVMIGRGFMLGCFPITVGEFRAFSSAHAAGEDPSWPAVNVDWNEACAYCAWLRSETGEAFRLPSEAEWEFACRAGTRSPFATGIEITTADANFLYAENGERIGIGSRTAVGRYATNAFGLGDLHGNVCEWVEDVWHVDYRGAPADGSAWVVGGDSERRVIRGGAWDYLPRLLRSAWRDSLPVNHRRDNVGFRIARTLDS
jgi:formylglycine-generating enzyme required for sulfatase activity